MKLNNPLTNLTLKLTNKCMYLENGVECEKMSEEEAKEMASLLGRIYIISHQQYCKACRDIKFAKTHNLSNNKTL